MQNSTDILNKINDDINNNELKQAFESCNYITQAFPNLADGWYQYSRVLAKIKNFEIALIAVNSALAIEDNNSLYITHKAMCLNETGNSQDALNLANSIFNTNTKNVTILNTLALIFNDNSLHEKSKKTYLKIKNINPNCSFNYLNLAIVDRALGLISSAVSHCKQAIKIDMHNYDAHFLLSSLSTQTNEVNNIHTLKQLLKTSFNNQVEKSKIYYALAKELEDCKNYTESFEERSKGAMIYKNSLNYNLKSDLEFMDTLTKVYTKNVFKNNSDITQGENVIFVLGLPRTGSTLLERILSSHSQVNSAGELTDFNKLMVDMISQLAHQPNLSRTQLVELSTNLDFAKLGRDYLEKTKKYGKKSLLFIDKFPQNSLYIGLIHLALPQAKIILTQRDPMDSCYAIYKQLFTDIYQYSYDLESLGEYYIAHQKLMKHWQDVMPNKIHIVEYENIVNHLETTTKELLHYCNLTWQDKCLEFYNNNLSSTTASATQVRKKIYSSSIGMWKNYSSQLEVLQKKLIEADLI